MVSIAGVDPSGGAGVFADLKAFSALGAYGCGVVAALTAQNTQAVTGVHVPPTDFLRLQIDTLFADVAIRATKIGMLGSAEVTATVAERLAHWQAARVVLSAVPVDAVNTMGIPPDDAYAQKGEPPVWAEFRQEVKAAGLKLELQPVLKWDFYKAVESADHILTIQTGDQALWGNVLLTVGCRTA